MEEKDYDYSNPFRVKIVRDCRETENKLNGQAGTCLGLYEHPDTTRKAPDGAEKDLLKYNPLIKTDGGEYIWGIECWWIDEESAEIADEEAIEKQLCVKSVKDTIEDVVNS